jgi:hypothetical protein
MIFDSRLLEAPTLVVFALSLMVVIMLFGLYIGFFGVFSHT